MVSTIRPSRPRPSRPSRIRCCSTTGRLPISGRLPPSGAAPVSAPCRRVSVKSAISDGSASEMIDEFDKPSPARLGSASKAAAASRSTSGSGRSGGASAALPPACAWASPKAASCSSASCSGAELFWPHSLILFTKLISPSQGFPRSLTDDLEEQIVSRQLDQTQLLPDPRRSVAIARADECRTGAGLVVVAGQIALAAQTRESVDEQHAVDVERLVETDQASLLAPGLYGLDAEKTGQVDDPVQMAAQVGHAEKPAVAVRNMDQRRHGEDLARVAQGKEKAARAALDGEPRTAERLGTRRPQAFGEPGLEVAQGLLVCHSLQRPPGRPKGAAAPSGGSERRERGGRHH